MYRNQMKKCILKESNIFTHYNDYPFIIISYAFLHDAIKYEMLLRPGN